jgi:predicted TIM-barrel fold metal-dependent hydrolase
MGADAAAKEGQPAQVTGPAWRPGFARPPILDVHAHVMPSGLERMAEIMRDNGLAMVVNLSGGSFGRGLEISEAMAQRLPGLINFYTPNWRAATLPEFGAREAAALELAVKSHGFRGLKIAKILGIGLADAEQRRVPVDWPELDPLWAKAGELGVPVAIHTGDPKAFWEPVTPENERYDELSVHPGWSYADGSVPPRLQLLAERDRMVAKHPKTTFICVHFGSNSEDLAYVDKLLDTYPNVVIDTAARLGEIGRHPPAETRAFFIKHRKRILFGTDLGLSAQGIMLGSTGADEPTMADVKPFYDAHWRFFEGKERGIPHPTPIQGRWTIDAIDLPDDVLEDIYFGNAARLLKISQ